MIYRATGARMSLKSFKNGLRGTTCEVAAGTTQQCIRWPVSDKISSNEDEKSK